MDKTPVVACVEWGNYLGRGEEYVRKLRSMVKRHLQLPHHFVVLTDDARRHVALQDAVVHILPASGQLKGWWAKLHLFSPFRFIKGTRVLYLDLDTVVTGPLEPLVAHKGILHLADWGWKKNDYGSGVMVWDAGEHEEIWTFSSEEITQRFRGDQDWMTHLGGWDALPGKTLCRSYRYHSIAGPPSCASVIAFHGTPKPHEVTTGWVPLHWR